MVICGAMELIQCRGTNLQAVEDFMGGKGAYGVTMKANWGNGEVKIKTRYGWIKIEKGENAWIVHHPDMSAYEVISNEVYEQLI